MATLYRIECTATGKSYIGVCLCSTKQRWLDHCGDARLGSKLPLHAAIRKYGKDAFKRFVVQCDLPEDQRLLVQLEAEYIAKRGTLFPNGYNKRKGGGTFRHSEETKRRMSAARKLWMADPANLKRLSKSLRRYKSSEEGRATMVQAGLESWGTRRSRYTEEQISEIARTAAAKRDSSRSGRKSWATRRKRYTKEEISQQLSEAGKRWHAKVRRALREVGDT